MAVLLHGRGSHRGDLQALRPHLPDDLVLVTPQAPHPGHPWGYGPGWAWYKYAGEDRVVAETLQRSKAALRGFLAELSGLLGLRPGSVFLGGFSQGGTVSMAYALEHPGTVDGVLNFSGFLAAGWDEGSSPGGGSRTPIFWGHGLRDPKIPHALALRGRERLARAGARVEARDYDIGHWIAPEEVRDAVSFLRGVRDRTVGGAAGAGGRS